MTGSTARLHKAKGMTKSSKAGIEMTISTTHHEISTPFSALHAKPIQDLKVAGIGLEKLTDQQTEVAIQLSQGCSNKIIAHTIKRSQATVKAHLSAILRALGCTNRTQAALLIYQWRAANRSAEGDSVSRSSGCKNA